MKKIMLALFVISGVVVLNTDFILTRGSANQEFIKTQYDVPKKNYVVKDVPIDNKFKSFMDANKITSKTSRQMQLKKQCTVNDYGIYTYKGRLCIAMGTYYADKVGTYIDLVMESGKVVKCILSESKKDIHTDSKHQQDINNGSVVEVLVDTNLISTKELKAGSISSCGLCGQIKEVKVYDICVIKE